MDKLRTHIEEKIRFTTDTTVFGIKRFNPEKAKHRKEVIDRIIALAVDVYGGGSPSPASHRALDASWSVRYKTESGDTADKVYISPIEVLSPFNSSVIEEVEIKHAGSGP